MNELKQEVADLRAEVKKLKHEVKELKKRLTFILDATKIEVWTDIRVAPEYMISSFGRVRRKRDEYEPKITFDKGTGYYRVYLNGKLYLLHRLLAQAFIPNPEGKPFVDHIDGNPLNNALSNLRWATATENQRNSKKRKDNTSDFRGVSFHKASGKWQAQIYVNGKNNHLGLYDTPEEAAAAYEKAARKEFGEFYRAPE